MTVFLLEAYMPGSSASELEEIVERLREASNDTAGVRYVRSAFVPEDETCFHYVEAPGRPEAELVASCAGLSVDRVLEVRDAAVPRKTDSKEGQ